MKLFFRKFLVYLITAVLVVPSWLVTSYLTAETAMAAPFVPTSIASNIGNIAAETTWVCTDCTQQTAASNDYIVMTKATSSLISPPMNFLPTDSEKLVFSARTYGTIQAPRNAIDISVSTDNGGTWSLIKTVTPLDNVLTLQDPIDLSLYNGQKVLIKFETKNAVSGDGVGIDDIKIEGAVLSDIESPTATATLDETTKTITYTFSEPVQLIDQNNGAVTALTSSLLGIYDYDKSTGDYTNVKVNQINTAVLNGNVLTIVYNSDLLSGDYLVDAWGYSIMDMAGNRIVKAASQIFTVDKIAPTATLSSSYPVATSENPLKLTLKCSEAVAGLDISKLKITNGTASNLGTADHKDFTFDVVPTAEGSVVVELTSGTISDDAGNSNADSVSTTIVYDKTSPVIILAGDAIQTVNFGSTYTDAGATVTDNLDATVQVVASGTVDTTKEGDYTISYDAIDLASNKAVTVVRTVKVLAAKPTQAVATSGMTVTTPTEIVVPKGYAENMDIKVTTGGTTLNLAPSLQDGKDAAGVANKSAKMEGATKISAEISSGNTIVVNVASGTTVTGPATWDGVVKLPEVTVNPTSVTVNSGNYPTNVASIEIGMPDVKLIFDKAVRILIPGGAGRSVGYTRSDVFTPINAVCAADTQAAGDALLAEGDCKIDAGADLVIWTKHFTKFVTYTQTLVTVPVFTATVVSKDSAKYLDINWKGTGADSYLIKVNDVLISTITGNANDTNLSYNSSLKVLEGIKYVVSVIAVKNNVQSINNIATTVSVPATVVVPQPEVITTPAVSAPAPTTSVAPAKAKAAAPEEKKVETPKDDDAGIVKGEESNTDDANNWTPWIILFVLILLAGAATGGYFYWFSDKPEVAVTVKDKAKGKTVEPAKIVEKQKETVKQVVQPEKKVQVAKPVQMASKKNHKKTKRW
ncbi:MAG: immunoglobulin-like domain-containing protein [Candidatus Berkelbacteria bacterium]